MTADEPTAMRRRGGGEREYSEGGRDWRENDTAIKLSFYISQVL
jgi:hypothetical protein